MKYLIYKTTNNINGKIYIGCHKTEDINDSYLGSGKVLRQAISKHGRDNFSKEIIEIFDNSEDMFSMEAQLVNEEFIQDSTNYNIKIGGEGGWDYINNHLDLIFPEEKLKERAQSGRKAANKNGAHLKGAARLKQLMDTDQEFRSAWVDSVRRAQALRGPSFIGKKHTSETKRKIGEANSIKQKGTNNSNYGKCWVYSEKEKKTITILKSELDRYINDGWVKGRKLKW